MIVLPYVLWISFYAGKNYGVTLADCRANKYFLLPKPEVWLVWKSFAGLHPVSFREPNLKGKTKLTPHLNLTISHPVKEQPHFIPTISLQKGPVYWAWNKFGHTLLISSDAIVIPSAILLVATHPRTKPLKAEGNMSLGGSSLGRANLKAGLVGQTNHAVIMFKLLPQPNTYCFFAPMYVHVWMMCTCECVSKWKRVWTYKCLNERKIKKTYECMNAWVYDWMKKWWK